MGKSVDGIRMKNGMDETIQTTGFLTDDQKFVVAAQARFDTKSKWTPTKKANGTEYRIIMRMDISVSSYDEKNGQGSFVLPYVSARLLQIRGSFGTRLSVATPFDNEQKKQYPNLMIDQKVFEAMKDAIRWAIEDSTERAEQGKAMVTASNSDYISNANKLLEVSEKLSRLAEAQAPQTQQQTQQGVPTNAEKIADVFAGATQGGGNGKVQK